MPALLPARVARRSLRAAGAVLLALASTLPSGCGGAPPPPASSSADIPAPYPFTVYDIRAGCPYGRVIEYRIEKPGSPPRVERWAFTPLDQDTVSITTTSFDAEGKSTGAPATESAKWTELHEHARFPQSATTISNESLALAAGTFDVMRYVVTRGAEVKTYWFARSLPGPPVKMEIARDGKTVMTMTMEANRTH